MDFEIIFRSLTFFLFTAALAISGYHRRKADREAGTLENSAGQKLLIALRIYALLVILPLFGYWINPAWVAWARLEVPVWFRWAAGLLAAGMLPAFLWIFRHIGQNISPTQATRHGHELVTTGPYRYVRHPLYLCGFIFFAALAALSGLWWLGLGLAIGMIPILYRTPREEKQLIAAFGDDYKDYMNRTGRYFPRLWRTSTREEPRT